MDYKGIVLESVAETASKLVSIRPEMREIGEETSPITVEDFTIIIGMAGQISGQLIFGFREEMVKKIAEKMLEQETEELDELTISAVAEFTNVISGNATIKLVDAGSKKLGMSPPSIVMGKNMRISTKIKPINKYKLFFDGLGDVVLHVALKEKED